MLSFVIYNRFKQPVRSFDRRERAEEFIKEMEAQVSTFTLKPTRMPKHASN